MVEYRRCIGIGTKNRSEGVANAVASALANGGTEVIVVDQNDDDRLVEVLAPLADNPALRHVRIDRPGTGHARNVVLALTDAEVICFTDDDCIVPPDFASLMDDAFAANPTAGMVFGEVVAGDVANELGYVPEFRPGREYVIRKFTPVMQRRRLGIGAAMGIRRPAADDTGGFDSEMGPGTQFPASEDRDLAVRMLIAGWAVVMTPTISVDHYGTRVHGGEVRALMKRDHLGVGATLVKLPRSGVEGGYRYLATNVSRIVADVWRGSVKHRRPRGLGRLLWTGVGLWRGLRQPIDREHVCFRTPPVSVPPLS